MRNRNIAGAGAMALLLAVSTLVPAAAQYAPQYLYWLRYQNQLQFSPKVYWNNEFDNRRFIRPDVQHQLIFHSRLHYRAGAWDFGGGITTSLAYQAIPGQGHRRPLTELRPVAEVNHEYSMRRVALQQRFRVDSRFLQEDREAGVFEQSNHVMRYRYRLQFRVPLVVRDSATTVSLRVSDEIMVNGENNFYDQNRLYVSAEFALTRSLALETGYIYIHQRRFGREEFFDRHVLRFSILHRLRAG